jgi:hypothetical protein
MPRGLLRNELRKRQRVLGFEYRFRTLTGIDKCVLHDSYLSIFEALMHGAVANDARVVSLAEFSSCSRPTAPLVVDCAALDGGTVEPGQVSAAAATP